MKQEKEFFCKIIANEKAQNQEFWEPLLVEMIFDYQHELNYFVKQNDALIQKYLAKKNKTQLISPKTIFHYSDFEKLWDFLNSGNDLTKNLEISKAKFDQYQMLGLEEEKSTLQNFVTYTAKKLKFKEIERIHNYLQFIIAFYKLQNIRTKSIGKALLLEGEKDGDFENLANQKINSSQIINQLEKQDYYYVQAKA